MMVKTNVMKYPKFAAARVRKFSDFKEKGVLLARRPSQKSSKRMELEYTYMRNKTKFMAQHYESTLSKLHADVEWYTSCFVQLLEKLHQSKIVIEQERRDNMQHLAEIEGATFHCNKGLKTTQAVRPMVSGLPLKRASITLKRLNPFILQQGSRVLVVNNNATSSVHQPSQSESVAESEHNASPSAVASPTVEDSQSTSDEQEVGPPSRRSTLLRSSRCGICREVPSSAVRHSHSTPPRLQRDLRLKEASILLTRVDPRQYLCHEGVRSNLQSELDEESDAESTVSARRRERSPSVSSGEESVISIHDNSMQEAPVRFRNIFSKESGRKNCVPDPRPAPSPLVLERLERYEYFENVNEGENSSEMHPPLSAPASVFNSFEEKMCQRRENKDSSKEDLPERQGYGKKDTAGESHSRTSSPVSDISPVSTSSPKQPSASQIRPSDSNRSQIHPSCATQASISPLCPSETSLSQLCPSETSISMPSASQASSTSQTAAVHASTSNFSTSTVSGSCAPAISHVSTPALGPPLTGTSGPSTTCATGACQTSSANPTKHILRGKRKPLVALVDVRGTYGSADCVKVKRLDGENVAPQNASAQAETLGGCVEEKQAETVRKSIPNPPVNGRVRKSKKTNPDKEPCEQDPLEGPSWLYEGNKPHSRMRKLKKLREEYPIYVQDDSDDSADEEVQTDKKRKNKKRGKKKKIDTRFVANTGVHISC